MKTSKWRVCDQMCGLQSSFQTTIDNKTGLPLLRTYESIGTKNGLPARHMALMRYMLIETLQKESRYFSE